MTARVKLAGYQSVDTAQTRRIQFDWIPARVQSSLFMTADELGAFDRIFTRSRHGNSRVG